MTSLAVRQLAFFVSDIRASAERHARLFGSGPYYVAEHIPLRACLYRGRPAPLDHSSAYGQWGDVMVEFVQQNNDGPSAFRDLYAPGEEGFHHVALIVDDFEKTWNSFKDRGCDTALYAEMNSGFPYVMMDAVHDTGHMIEIYESVPALTKFYGMVKSASVGFDGADLLRPLRLD